MSETVRTALLSPEKLEARIRDLMACGAPARHVRAIATEEPEEAPYLTRWRFLFGPSGSGKTHRAVQLLHALLKAKAPARRIAGDRPSERFVDWPQLLERRKAVMGSREETDPFPAIVASKSLVIVDDFGSERPTDFGTDSGALLVAARYAADVPTIFTSNLSLDQIAAVYGDRTASRIAEAADVVRIAGEDFRVGLASGLKGRP